MNQVLLDLLACPTCQGTLHREHHPSSNQEHVTCGTCQVRAPIIQGIPRFVSSDGYAQSFSDEWQRFHRTQLDSANGSTRSAQRLQQSLAFPLTALEGKVILDAGCGMGRFAEVAARYGATVIGVDLSYAIDVAAANLASWPQAHFVQANLQQPPFRPGTFDLIYSLGVLHHTPDPPASFAALVPLLKPGGTISITVYSRYNKIYVASTTWWRRLTTRLPRPWVYALSHLAIPLYHLYRLPLIGAVGKAVWPISLEPDPVWRVLDTFDCYTPTYQFYYTHPEVYRWFQAAGLTDIGVLESAISFIGTRRS